MVIEDLIIISMLACTIVLSHGIVLIRQDLEEIKDLIKKKVNMKELSIEQKAKAYDEAKARMSEAYNSNRCTIGFMNEIFPELRESEGEKIRKHLISLFENFVTLGVANECETADIKVDNIIAWLEKQSEQKPAEWSAEDEEVYRKCICAMRASACGFSEEEKFVEQVDNWLKSLKDRVQPQPKQEWSKEDKVMLDEIIDFFENGTVKLQHDLSLYASWLKSLKQRYTWKPSDEQMANLSRAFNGATYNNSLLMDLYIDLKKLKE